MPMTPTPPIIVATGEVGIDNAPQVPAVGAREPTGEALEIAVPAPFTIAAVPTVMLAIAHVPAAIMIEDCLLLGAESGIEGFERRPRGFQAVDLEAQHRLGHAVSVEGGELGASLGHRGETGGTQFVRPVHRCLTPLVPERLLLGIELEPRLEIGQMPGLAGVLFDANLLRRESKMMILGAICGGP